jgi:hypothetical protein
MTSGVGTIGNIAFFIQRERAVLVRIKGKINDTIQ